MALFSDMAYVDGYVLAVPAKRLGDYKKVAAKAGKIWKEHGALEYWECVGEDMQTKFGKPFPKTVRAKPDEVIVFAWVIFKSRKHRDAVNKKVMEDPRIHASMEGMDPNLFDMKRMVYGGFTPMVKF